MNAPGDAAAPGVGGLTEAQARQRLAEEGPNELPQPRPHPVRKLLGKLWGPIPWMLEATIVLQAGLGKLGEAGVIAALLVVNAAISFVEEGRADRALDLLRKRMAPVARVQRDGAWRSIPAAELVPGDRVHLRMGDIAPADLEILDGTLLLDQSALTGESEPVEAAPSATAYAASVVRRGEATAKVTATGRKTYFGKTAELVRTARSESHLAATIFKIVRVLVAIDVVLIGLLLAYAASVGLPFRDVAPFALILLVASVPVALPATFTLATALGAAELARSGVLLTRLAAIEEAAGMDVLCTDKTGTLTENRLTLSQWQRFAAATDEELLRAAALASDSATQDPIDMALLQAAESRGLLADVPSRLTFVPFDPATRYTLAGYRGPSGEQWVAKGAPAAVAALLPAAADTAAAIERLTATGARVLAVAAGASRSQLRLAGLVALEDPPRSDSAALVRGLKELGIRVIMVTGDGAATAAVVARRVGIEAPVAPADALDHLDGDRALEYGVFARVFPQHKIALVRTLQHAGHVVGMTGDGVNDAPALKQADVGIAVSSATDVARAAAGVVLTAPGLVDALNAVRISRRIYQRMLTYTINKIMKTLEIAIFLTVGVLVTHAFVITPLLIVLLLFTNDFVTMSIATDHVGYAAHPERWHVRSLMTIGAALAALVLVLSFAVFFVGRDVFGLPLPQLQTLVFVMLVATGQGNVYLIRERDHFWRSRPSRWLLISSLVDVVLVAVMATLGVLMAPVSGWLVLALLMVVAAYLLVIDTLKVRLFRALGSPSTAGKPATAGTLP